MIIILLTPSHFWLHMHTQIGTKQIHEQQAIMQGEWPP